ncbi:MAG: hypothetical protein RLZZ312_494 [Bacteroidota bacterium]|jgi:hypothetical protein
MKKLILLFSIGFCLSISAQKSTYLVQGGLSYQNSNFSNSDNTTKSKSYSFGLSSKLGYQYSEHSTIGLDFSLGNYSYNYNLTSGLTDSANNIYVGGFYRYSKKISDLFTLYSDFGSGINFSKVQSNIQTAARSRVNYLNFNITPAVFLNLSNNFGLNFNLGGIGYSSIIGSSDNALLNQGNSFLMNLGSSFVVGVSKNF